MKYLDLLGLTEFLNKCKGIFATIVHKHTMSDITDYKVDTALSSTSTNPVENKAVQSAIQKLTDEKAEKDELPTKVSELTNDSGFVTNDDVNHVLNQSIADWNQSDENAVDYIKNKPFYEEIVETGEVTEVYNDSVTDYVMLNAISYDFGEMLYVTFDGVKYKLYGHRSGIICSYTSNEGDVPFYVSYNLVDATLSFTCKDSGTHMVLIEIPVIESIVHKLDSKFIPYTVVDKEYLAQKLDSSIADWNQSDETAADYIKNRPFYEETIETGELETICYSESRDYDDYSKEYWSYEHLSQASTNQFYVDYIYITIDNDGVKHKYIRNDLNPITWEFIPSDNSDLPVKDIFVDELDYTVLITYNDTTTNHTVLIEKPITETNIVQLDEKFIPDTIARGSNIATVNARINDHEDNENIHVTSEKQANWNAAYTHSQAAHARVDATNVAKSNTNGNILINGTETKVYTHPSGTNPHGTTRADVGLGNVDNTSDANKPVSTAQKAAIDAVQTNVNTVDDKVDDHIADTDIHFTAAERTKLSGIATGANKYTHPNSGVTAGTYKSVTVNAAGHVTGGTNPTTLAGYGITDAEAKGSVNTHNTSTSAHNDIRLLVSDISTKLNNFLNVDDTTKDQLSEIIALIDANADDIESITSGKVNISDIVNNLTTNVSNKPLSAAQGVAIKSLIDALQTEVDGKADDGHEHAIADVSGLQSALDGKANSSHGTHVTWSTTTPKVNGTAAVGSETKVARGDHVHPTDTTRAAKSDLDALTTTVSGKSDVGHKHTISDVTNLQSSLDAKQAAITGGASSITSNNLTASRALVSDASGKVAVSAVTSTELSYLDGVTSAIQSQIDSKAASGHGHDAATTSASGFMTSAMVTKLNGIATGAEVNQNAFSNVKVGSTTVTADSKTDTIEFVGSNVTITPDATNDKITFAVANGSTSAKGIVQLTDSTSSTSTTTAATPKNVKAAYDLANTAKTNAATVQSNLDAHIDDKNNPHCVDCEQIGALKNASTSIGEIGFDSDNECYITIDGTKYPILFGVKRSDFESTFRSYPSNYKTNLNEFTEFGSFMYTEVLTNCQNGITQYGVIWNIRGYYSGYMIQYQFDAVTKKTNKRFYVDGVWSVWYDEFDGTVSNDGSLTLAQVTNATYPKNYEGSIGTEIASAIGLGLNFYYIKYFAYSVVSGYGTMLAIPLQNKWLNLKFRTSDGATWTDWAILPTSYSPLSYIRSSIDNRGTTTQPNNYNDKFEFVGLKNESDIGLSYNSGFPLVGLLGFRPWSDSSGGNAYEIAFPANGGAIFFRDGSTTTWGVWNQLYGTNNIKKGATSLTAGSSGLAENSIYLQYLQYT